MAKRDDWLSERLDRLEGKMDKVTSETIPALLVEVARITAEGKTEAKTTAKIQGRIYGGIALVLSLASLAVAYFKG